jgi:hypothetical protein
MPVKGQRPSLAVQFASAFDRAGQHTLVAKVDTIKKTGGQNHGARDFTELRGLGNDLHGK